MSPRRKKTDRPRRHVCLLVQTANDWSRQVLTGVASYAHEHGHWDFYIEPRGFYERLRLPKGWRGDGVITRLTHPGLTGALRRAGLPAVNVSWLGRHNATAPKVVSDEAACGRLAAEHFLEKGIRSLGYVGPDPTLGYDDTLGAQFAATAAGRNVPCQSLSLEDAAGRPADVARRQQKRAWIARLPRPVGILVWNSAEGRDIISIATSMKLHVPDDVAVLCSEHDPLMSALAPLPLSNIDQTPTRVGYEAAALLDRMMSGEPPPESPILIAPLGIIHRQSSDTTAVDDPLVAAGLRFIRESLGKPIRVVDLQRHLGCSRRVIEYRFEQALGRTPAAEIRRGRLQHARRLLVETDLSVAAIAARVGFHHTEVLIRTFSRELGLPPGAFRKRR